MRTDPESGFCSPMMIFSRTLPLLVSALFLPAPMYGENDVMGEIQFEGIRFIYMRLLRGNPVAKLISLSDTTMRRE
jgi:hypothetical protein